MKENEEARLVFSTATHVDGCEQIEGYDGGLGSEARQERNESIDLLNKSVRRTIKEKHFIMRDKVLQTRKDVSALVACLWKEKMTFSEMYKSLYGTHLQTKTNRMRLRNLVQILRFGSGGIIASKHRLWQVDENAKPASMLTLVNQIMDRRSKLYEKKSSNGEQKPVSKKESIIDPAVTKKPKQIPKSINKKLVIDSPVGEITINLNIKITVEGV